jgi:hypothetical protein
MPWLHKFRELSRPEDFGEADDEEGLHLRNSIGQSIVVSKNRQSLLSRLSRDSMGKRRGLSAFDNDDIEKTERIAEIRLELERLQNELSDLQANDDDSC